MSTYLGIDYGAKRIGLAVGADDTGVASPLKMLPSHGDLRANAKSVAHIAAEYEIDAFVVGLPLNMDDTEGPQAKTVRAFGEVLAEVTGKPIHYFDERLSSVEAEELMRPADLTRKRKTARLDGVAAQVILQAFMDERSAE